MSDFIYTNNQISKEAIAKSFKRVYNSNFLGFDYHYANGKTLAVSKNIYNGFQKFETDKHICAVLGGPVLSFRNNNFITQQNSNEGTKSIYQRWIVEKNIVWHKDLDGPFVVILFDKLSGELIIVTDILSFIPVFKSKIGTISTHLNMIDDIENCTADEVSIADFIINDVVTFPYTIFKEVEQLFPASEHYFEVLEDNINHTYDNYWLPKEETHEDISLQTLKLRLRKGIKTYIDRILEASPKVGILLSGGEDSRAVLGMIPLKYPKDCFIYSQNDTLEVNIARKVTLKYGGAFIRIPINESYIKDTFLSKAELIGIGNDCAHVHSYRHHKELQFENYDVILGGFLADSFLKALYIPKKGQSLSFVNPEASRFFSDKILNDINSRKIFHHNKIKEIRSEGYTEWSGIFPASMNKHLPNIDGHRRIIRNFEPFTCNEVVKIAAIAPKDIKLNRILFQSAMKPFFKKSKWVIHDKGHLPYFSYKFNFYWKKIYKLMQLPNRIVRKLSRKKSGSTWFNWKDFLDNNTGVTLYNQYIPPLKEQFPELLKSINKKVFDNDLSDTQRRNILQLGYHLGNKQAKKLEK